MEFKFETFLYFCQSLAQEVFGSLVACVISNLENPNYCSYEYRLFFSKSNKNPLREKRNEASS